MTIKLSNKDLLCTHCGEYTDMDNHLFDHETSTSICVDCHNDEMKHRIIPVLSKCVICNEVLPDWADDICQCCIMGDE